MDAAIATDRPIGIAILAMGGQGGGVLSDWIVAMAEAEGWVAQATSVPGVAQRTGATIYYVELIRARPGMQPVLSLMPVPGDVDVVIAAELMEAGRAMQRGLVSPDRTVLIASTHRAYAVTEKQKPGDGRAAAAPVLAAASAVSARVVAADMQAIAERAGSVISAALFGALAGSGALPFPRAAFEAAIRAGGVGVQASLAAFAGGADAVDAPPAEAAKAAAQDMVGGTDADRAALATLLSRIEAFPDPVRAMLRHGMRRLVDYQDIAYAGEYLDRMQALVALDRDSGGLQHRFALATEAARQLAVAMSYDDVIRVADLKTRATRFARVRAEVRAAPDQVMDTTEFFHPRVEELCATLPARWGARVERSPRAVAALRRVFEHGRRVRTTRLSGFLSLYLVAGMRRRRRTLLRHGREMAHVNRWLDLVALHAPSDYGLAVEILKCRRLVKGYGDTHARGGGKFDRVIGAVPLLAGRPDAADWLRRLREAALSDEKGSALDGALATIATL